MLLLEPAYISTHSPAFTFVKGLVMSRRLLPCLCPTQPTIESIWVPIVSSMSTVVHDSIHSNLAPLLNHVRLLELLAIKSERSLVDLRTWKFQIINRYLRTTDCDAVKILRTLDWVGHISLITQFCCACMYVCSFGKWCKMWRCNTHKTSLWKTRALCCSSRHPI